VASQKYEPNNQWWFGYESGSSSGPMLTMQEEEEGLTLESVSFFPSRSSISLHISSTLLFACLSNVELIMDWTSSRERDGLGHTSGVTSALWMMIGVASLRTAPIALPCNANRRAPPDQRGIPRALCIPPPSRCRRWA
jgi:hypothetical protein